jgi:hypothetical protein
MVSACNFQFAAQDHIRGAMCSHTRQQEAKDPTATSLFNLFICLSKNPLGQISYSLRPLLLDFVEILI